MLRSIAALLTRLITGMNPAWVDCEPDHPGFRVQFVNHGSHLDFTAFWDAFLLGNPETLAWLDGDGPRSVLEKDDRWRHQ